MEPFETVFGCHRRGITPIFTARINYQWSIIPPLRFSKSSKHCSLNGTLTFDMCSRSLSHWGRMTHICVRKLNIIGSDNGLSPGRHQAIIWTNAGIMSIGPSGTNFSEILIAIHTFSFKKIYFKMSSGKWRPFCLGLNVLTVMIHVSLKYERDLTSKSCATSEVPIINEGDIKYLGNFGNPIFISLWHVYYSAVENDTHKTFEIFWNVFEFGYITVPWSVSCSRQSK